MIKKLLVGLLFAALLGFLILRLVVFDVLTVHGPDMLPTLEPNQDYLVYKLGKDPERGDIVVFQVPGGGPISVRRVIAVGGDRVEYKNQLPVVNNKAADQEPDGTVEMTGPLARTLERARETSGKRSYAVARDPQRHSKDQPVLVVPAGSYYVVADNRNHGRDSREYGVVPASNLRGTVIRRVKSLLSYDPVE